MAFMVLATWLYANAWYVNALCKSSIVNSNTQSQWQG